MTRRAAVFPDRNCLRCKRLLVRKEGETSTNFRKRAHCDRSCGSSFALRKGQTYPKVETPCSTGCGAVLLRAVHYVDAKCRACKKAVQRRSENAYTAALKEDRKRLHVLVAAMGFGSFEETLEYLRSVPWVFIDGKMRKELREMSTWRTG